MNTLTNSQSQPALSDNMKKSILTSLLILAIGIAGTFNASAQVKIGTVDMKKCFDGYYKTKDAEANMNDVRSQVKKDLDERVEKFKQLKAEIDKLNDDAKKPELAKEKAAEKAKQRDEKVAEANVMMREIEQFRMEKEKQLADQTLRMRNGIVDEIKKIITDKVQADGYDIVFDVSGTTANSVPAVLYAKETYDFSKEVIEALNKNRPAKTVADKPAGATVVGDEKPAKQP